MQFKKVIAIGLDGLEPKITAALLAAGELPNLSAIMKEGRYSTLRTTYPALTPVAWSTFATGLNPGGHGIFDFIRRNPKTYLPDLSLVRYEQKSAFLPPRVVNLRKGITIWQSLSSAGIPSTVIRCPCTYPPDDIRGRLLSGMGVPDIRGGLGTSTFYTCNEHVVPQEHENVIHLMPDENGVFRTHIIGPRNPKTGADFRVDIIIRKDTAGKKITVHSEGTILEVREGCWSDWLKIKFKTGLLMSVKGMVRFHLVQTEPVLELYASPVNFDPAAPLFPISSPAEYSKELEERVGTFYTTGMVEDHTGLNNGRIGDNAFLAQCNLVMQEREKMLFYELNKHTDGFLFCLFDTPDRLQHMFWQANGIPNVIREHYKACDTMIGRVREAVDDRTLFMILSDHGMSSFRRGLHLNSWLQQNGFLTFESGAKPGERDFFHGVDWNRTKAYAPGLSGIYLNIRGREEQGILRHDEAESVRQLIIDGLINLRDVDGKPAIRRVLRKEQIYSGAYAEEAPDLLVNFEEGYRVSWATALGGIPDALFEDNEKRWAGDHIVDPDLVPGVLFINRNFGKEVPDLLDMAPTILEALGAPKGTAMEGESLLR